MNDLTLQAMLILTGTALAAYTDSRTGKIYNTLTGPLLLAGLLVNLFYGQVLVGVYGFLLATAIYMPTWFLKIQRGGDVKLIMGIGACMGHSFIINFTFVYALLYLIVGLVVLIVRGRLINLYILVKYHLFERIKRQKKHRLDPTQADQEDQASGFVPTILWTGPVIFAATIVTIYYI